MTLPTAQQVGRLLIRELGAFGIDGIVYAYRRVVAGRQMQLAGRTHLIAHHEPRFLAELFSDGHFARFWTDYGSNLPRGVTSWRDLVRRAEERSSAASLLEGRTLWLRHGLRAGYLIVLQPPGQHHGLMSLAASGLRQHQLEQVWVDQGAVIHALCQIAHLRITTMPPPDGRFAGHDPTLSPRQREVLEWVAVGKTVADVAAILGLRPATVEKHLRLARQMLGAETTTQAVMTATLRDHIFNLPGRHSKV
ncbi:LuxR C-terminal-related transcriptional regulator [Paracoccus sp. p4-l81]|uniref:helix-turn-helix transcriptional regulator n=1 Tax=Paracoccus sp. p4-l81 TaxID=3342806 RepID=UPI0035B96DD5